MNTGEYRSYEDAMVVEVHRVYRYMSKMPQNCQREKALQSVKVEQTRKKKSHEPLFPFDRRDLSGGWPRARRRACRAESGRLVFHRPHQ